MKGIKKYYVQDLHKDNSYSAMHQSKFTSELKKNKLTQAIG